MITYKVKKDQFIINFYLPKKLSGKVVLLLPGLPTSSNIDKLLTSFSNAGCVVFYPYLAGSFDSRGDFNGHKHIADLKKLLSIAHESSFTEIYFNKEINIGKVKEVILCGMSYGAFISLMGDNRSADKIILLSPALLFNQKDIATITKSFHFSEQMKRLLNLLKKAFPFSYRPNSYNELSDFLLGKSKIHTINNVLLKLDKISCPTLVLHGKSDKAIPFDISSYLQKRCINKHIKWFYPNVGHSNYSYTKNAISTITEFIND